MNKTRLTTLTAILALSAAAPAFSAAKTATAVFAGGCFWTMQHKMENVPGVTKVISGYGGGPKGHSGVFTGKAAVRCGRTLSMGWRLSGGGPVGAGQAGHPAMGIGAHGLDHHLHQLFDMFAMVSGHAGLAGKS